MTNFISNLHSYFIPRKYWDDEVVLRKKRIFVNASFLTTTFALSYTLVAYIFGMHHSIWMNIASFIVFFSCPWLLRFGLPYWVVSNLFIFQAFISTLWHANFDGGLNSSVLPWISIVPVTAILFNNTKNAWVWTGCSVLALIALGVLHAQGVQFIPDANMDLRYTFITNSLIGLVMIIFLFAVVLESAYVRSMGRLDQKNKEVEIERERSESLLQNILPHDVIDELQEKGHSEAKLFNDVTVLFSDFVNFTQISETMSPQSLVGELNYYFQAFDDIISKHGLEKIKTIGDAYMATGGLYNDDKSAHLAVINAALDMQEIVNERKEERTSMGLPYFEMRVGIHTGPVVAGIVGVKKFQYDIWGDTVNTASRMESAGEPHKVNISESTYEFIKDADDLKFHSRGVYDVKGKGDMEMYFVERKSKGVGAEA